jgi:hypothetical protein
MWSFRENAKTGLLLGAACATVSMLGMGAAVKAASSPVTFAQVIESSANTNPNVFSYMNSGNLVGGATLNATSVPVNFTFESSLTLPADLTGVQTGILTLTSSSTSAASTSFGGAVANQSFPTTDTLTITRTTPAAEGSGARTNLLSASFSGGNLMGFVGGTTPQLSADSILSNMTNPVTVTYSSDFVNFANATQNDLSVAFSSWDPTGGTSGLGIASDGLYNSATAAGAATFDTLGATTVIPEPSGLALSLLLLGFCGRRSRAWLSGLKTSVLA